MSQLVLVRKSLIIVFLVFNNFCSSQVFRKLTPKLRSLAFCYSISQILVKYIVCSFDIRKCEKSLGACHIFAQQFRFLTLLCHFELQLVQIFTFACNIKKITCFLCVREPLTLE